MLMNCRARGRFSLASGLPAFLSPSSAAAVLATSVMETKVLGAVLSDLQARYVKAAGLDKEDPNVSLLGKLAAQAYGQAKKK